MYPCTEIILSYAALFVYVARILPCELQCLLDMCSYDSDSFLTLTSFVCMDAIRTHTDGWNLQLSNRMLELPSLIGGKDKLMGRSRSSERQLPNTQKSPRQETLDTGGNAGTGGLLPNSRRSPSSTHAHEAARQKGKMVVADVKRNASAPLLVGMEAGWGADQGEPPPDVRCGSEATPISLQKQSNAMKHYNVRSFEVSRTEDRREGGRDAGEAEGGGTNGERREDTRRPSAAGPSHVGEGGEGRKGSFSVRADSIYRTQSSKPVTRSV